MVQWIRKVKILPPFLSMDLKSLLFMTGLLIVTVSCFALHFIAQFAVTIQNNLPLGLILFHYIGVIIGSGMYLWKFSTLNQNKLFIPYYAGLSISMVLMLLNSDIFVVSTTLFFSGFFVSIVFIVALQFFGFLLNNPTSDGVFFFWAMPGYSLLLIIEALLSDMTVLIHIGFLLILLGIGSCLFFLTVRKGEFSLPSRSKNKKLKYFFKRRENWPFFLFYSFIGFFFVNIYYSSIIVLNFQSYTEFVNFLIVVLASLIILFIPIGNLFDLIGRKKSMTIGIIFHALAYFFIILVQGVDSQLYPAIFGINFTVLIESLLFPVFLSLGFSIYIMGSVLFLIESEKTEDYIETAITGSGLFFVGIGSVFAVLLIEILNSGVLLGLITTSLNNQFILIPVFLLMAYIPALIIVFFSKETRIPSIEKYWWKSAQYVYILDKNYDIRYEDRLWAFQDDVDYEHFFQSLKNSILNNKTSTFNSIFSTDSLHALVRGSENCVLVLITTLNLEILNKKMSIFLNDFEAMGASMTKERLIELVHKYLVKQEYIEKGFSPLEQEKHFQEYLEKIKEIDSSKGD